MGGVKGESSSSFQPGRGLITSSLASTKPQASSVLEADAACSAQAIRNTMDGIVTELGTPWQSFG